eukprot:656262-Alexandrium_andersonii.AAC.1
MSASLVGSEMCIRDRLRALAMAFAAWHVLTVVGRGSDDSESEDEEGGSCLLYTSDAADDM